MEEMFSDDKYVQFLERQINQAHNFLNLQEIPEMDENNKPYSIVGRMILLTEKIKRENESN